MEKHSNHFVEKVKSWVGSPSSLVVHSIVFALAFTLGVFDIAEWDMVLLILTTAVSLEAIYLAIFIQMTVNHHTESLREVEEDVDDIQEDIEEISEDVDDIQEGLEEISEDVEDITEVDEKDTELKKKQEVTLETLASHMQAVLRELEELKKK